MPRTSVVRSNKRRSCGQKRHIEAALLAEQLVTKITKCVYHLTIPIGVHERVNGTIAVVTELNKL